MTENDTGAATSGSKSVKEADKKSRPGMFARVSLFLRQVVAEMRKVAWPTQRELITYSTVVLVFVLIIMAYVAGLDYGFGKLVFWVFSNPTADPGSAPPLD